MLTHWDVLKEVASRYGDREDSFSQEATKLQQYKKNNIPLVSLTNDIPYGLDEDKSRIIKRLARETGPMPVVLERINGLIDFQERNVLDKLSLKADAVCRILKNGAPFGTGFLIAKDIIITNHHVIDDPYASNDMLAEFHFELDVNNVPKKTACYRFDPKKFFLTSTLEVVTNVPNSGLDFTIIGIESQSIEGENLQNITPLYLDGNKGKIIKGESCVIIQHPAGYPKKIVLKDIAFFAETDTKIMYESDTLPGSSGALVIGLGTCEVVALHHSGLPKTDSKNRPLTKRGDLATDITNDADIDWVANVGIKISSIIQALTEAVLPFDMEKYRSALLRKTEMVSKELAQQQTMQPTPTLDLLTPPSINDNPIHPSSDTSPPKMNIETISDFLITAVNEEAILERIKRTLKVRYGQTPELYLAMPASAREGEIELFVLKCPFQGNISEEAQLLVQIPEILNAEADTPLHLNADNTFDAIYATRSTESFIQGDGLGTWDEEEFKNDYKESIYVKGKPEAEFRKWNWAATKFNKAIINAISPTEKGVRVVQFDTGYSQHSKVWGNYDLEKDYNFLNNQPDAEDEMTVGVLKQPGHGTRTGSILIGNEGLPIKHDGNCGLLSWANFKLTPFRIAETVIIINRQNQLAAALDMAITQGYDVITMSMGLPPTLATAHMARKAYQQGIIWCCAAGNEVQAVVAPAVFPGTIAVAASNPMDRDWKGSSRGDAVDITAPGEDVYVPILNKERQEDFSYGNGTSYATPHIAAAAAMWLAKYQTVLRDGGYSGWKRVEAFRQALKDSARKENMLPRKGFGSGILNAEKLMKTAPVPANKLPYQYDNWNDHAFFNVIQGYGELAKTYWNLLHDKVFGSSRGGQESLAPSAPPLSSSAQQLEQALFNTGITSNESMIPDSSTSLLERYMTIQSIIEQYQK